MGSWADCYLAAEFIGNPMRLTRLEIRNHSRIADTEIEVRDHLVLVGPNDVGKSSLLRCLDFLLNGRLLMERLWTVH